jgi:hypothetical protein
MAARQNEPPPKFQEMEAVVIENRASETAAESSNQPNGGVEKMTRLQAVNQPGVDQGPI